MTLETKKTVHFKRENIFGIERLYPFCPNAVAFCNITESKTFLRRHLTYLNELGFDVIIDGGEEENFKAGEKNENG